MQATAEQIAAWKSQYSQIFQVTVEDKTCYLKSPDRKTLAYATKAGQQNPLKFNEIILANCWLDGDEEIKTDDSLFFAVSGKLVDIMEVKEAELVKI